MSLSVRRILDRAVAAAVIASQALSACAPTPDVPPAAETAELAINRPTVIAYFIVPDGAVDTMPDLAVSADDWNYAMATLGDSGTCGG